MIAVNMKRFQSGSDKRKKKREEEKLRDKLPKLTQFFQSKNLSVENDISDNVSSDAGPDTDTSPPTSPACLASKNDEPSSCITAAHIPETDTCTEDAQDTA